MTLIFERMTQLLPTLNRRRITWPMVQRACQRLNVSLICLPLRLDGYFVAAPQALSGYAEIYLNSSLSEDLQIATAVHELKHAACDAPTLHTQNVRRIRLAHRQTWALAATRLWQQHLERNEWEACAMAALALLPTSKLRHASLSLFDVDDEFLTHLWRIRLYVFEAYRI